MKTMGHRLNLNVTQQVENNKIERAQSRTIYFFQFVNLKTFGYKHI